MEELYDYLIVGGGPAGATLARLIGRDRKVALIESSEAGGESKACGGLIAPDAQRMLGKFGLCLPGAVLESPQVFYVESKDLDTGNSQKYQRHYLNVDRRRFDDWLIDLIPEEVDIFRPCRYLNHEEKADAIVLTCRKGSHTITLRTRYLIGADGGQSAVRRKSLGDFARINRYVALQSLVKGPAVPRCYEVFFNRSLTDFYGWKIPKGDSFLIGIAMKGEKPGEKYEAFLKWALGDGFEEIERRACTVIRPRRRMDVAIHSGKRILFIGEAAGFISPSSAEGISFAFKSALLLSRAIGKSPAPLPGYRRQAYPLKGTLLRKRLKGLVMYNRFLRNLIFTGGIGRL